MFPNSGEAEGLPFEHSGIIDSIARLSKRLNSVRKVPPAFDATTYHRVLSELFARWPRITPPSREIKDIPQRPGIRASPSRRVTAVIPLPSAPSATASR